MEEKERKTDRRTVYTRKQIMDAYIQLLKEKPKEKIRVTEICRLAEINRCTFYLHFLDVVDVEEAIEKELVEKFNHFIQLQDANSKNNQSRLFLSNRFQKQMLSDDTFVTLMKTYNPAMHLLKEVKFFGQNQIFETLVNKNGLTRRQAELLYEFIVGGINAVRMNWIDNDVLNIEEENKLLDLIVHRLIALNKEDL